MLSYAKQAHAATAYLERAANNGTAGLALANWRQALEQRWPALRFAEVKFMTDNGQHTFEIQLYLDGLDPNFVRVELYANGINYGPPELHEMTPLRQLVGATGGYVYGVAIPVTRAAADYTARVIPRFKGAAVPLEANFILWQR